jgi:uncharacterized protein YggE
MYLKPVIVAMFAFLATTAAHSADRSVHVTGTGLVRVVPDRVAVSLTMATVDDDLLRVRASSDEQARTVMQLAKKHGGSEDLLEVSRLGLSLSFNEQLRRQIYNVQRDATITLDDLSKLDALLSDLLKLKDTTVKTIAFSTSRTAELTLEARQKAVEDARKAAQQMAVLSELKLGKALKINLVEVNQRPFVTSVMPVVGDNPLGAARPPRRLSAGAGGFVSLEANKTNQDAADQPDDANPLALGLIEISTSVDIQYEMLE